MLTPLVLLASLVLVKADATIVGSDAPSQLLTLYSQFPNCAKQCVSSQFQVTVGSANLKAGVLTLDDVIYFCQDPNTQKGLTDCINKACPANDPSLINRWDSTLWAKAPATSICTTALAQDKVDISIAKSNATSGDWSKYYTTTMTNYDWINLREGIKTLIQVKQYGPVLLRLAWHDASTGNILDGTGGPHATMLLQDPEDPQNKGLQRAIDALAPLYEIYADKISNADLWSYAGALAVRVMGGPIIPWRPGRNDITDINQARLGEANRIPSAKDSWNTQLDKFAKFGMNSTDLAALIHGGHGVGRCHREYSGYHGPWTGEENTFSNFYGPLTNRSWPGINETLPDIKSWQMNLISPVNGAAVMKLPSDVEVVNGITDAVNSPKPGVLSPNADKKFLAFSADKDYFFMYFTDVFVRLLEVTLDKSKLGGYVSTDPADPFGWVPVKTTTTQAATQASQTPAQAQNQAPYSGLVASTASKVHIAAFVLLTLFACF